MTTRTSFQKVTSPMKCHGQHQRPVRYNIMISALGKIKMAYALLGFGIFSYICPLKTPLARWKRTGRQKNCRSGSLSCRGQGRWLCLFSFAPGQNSQGRQTGARGRVTGARRKSPLDVLIVGGFLKFDYFTLKTACKGLADRKICGRAGVRDM
jgi:hypothetical protein